MSCGARAWTSATSTVDEPRCCPTSSTQRSESAQHLDDPASAAVAGPFGARATRRLLARRAREGTSTGQDPGVVVLLAEGGDYRPVDDSADARIRQDALESIAHTHRDLTLFGRPEQHESVVVLALSDSPTAMQGKCCVCGGESLERVEHHHGDLDPRGVTQPAEFGVQRCDCLRAKVAGRVGYPAAARGPRIQDCRE